jgi:aldehyde dehydrogenase (NAD+)
MFDSVNPARPAEVLGRFPSSSAADVDRAVATAAEAQREWAQRPVPARAELIARAADVLAARKRELAELVAREAGKVLVEAGGDVQEAVDMGRFVAGQGRAAMGHVVPSELKHKMAWTTRQPIGVVGMITPWNFPVAILLFFLMPRRPPRSAQGTTLSPHTPLCADAFKAALVEAGLPSALLNHVHGAGEQGAALAVHPGIGAVSFTGSVPTGRKVAASAMETGPRVVSLELGGKNAMVVLGDADLDLVVEGALFGAFGTAGQRCTSTSRLVLHRGVADTTVERIARRAEALVLGDPLVTTTDVGPVVDRRSAERIVAMIDAAVAEGATVVTGGRLVEVDGCEGGAFVAPTVLTGVRPEHAIARDEVFGPVLSVIEVGTEEEAVDVVNASEFGLSAAVYTRDINVALQMVDRIDTGIVYVNAPTIGAEIPLPFGGTKHTGNGFREAGTRGIEQFSQVKTVYVDYSGRLQKAQIDTHTTGSVGC